jgi:hypothetical protein
MFRIRVFMYLDARPPASPVVQLQAFSVVQDRAGLHVVLCFLSQAPESAPLNGQLHIRFFFLFFLLLLLHKLTSTGWGVQL